MIHDFEKTKANICSMIPICSQTLWSKNKFHVDHARILPDYISFDYPSGGGTSMTLGQL
jgi:hypothetical protein